MKTLKIIGIVIVLFIAIYVVGILAATLGNNMNAYGLYPTLVAEAGFMFRLLILVALSSAVWILADNRRDLIIGLAFTELLIVLLASVGHMFGTSEFILGAPLGLILQDIAAQIGIGQIRKLKKKQN